LRPSAGLTAATWTKRRSREARVKLIVLAITVRQEFARHEVVNHGADEYVRGDAYMNTAEPRFSL
jgi:hypothetical protein